MGSAGETYSFLLSALIAGLIFLVFMVSIIGDVTEHRQILHLVSYCMSFLNITGLAVGVWIFLQSGLSVFIVAGKKSLSAPL
jgi:hypothetical protein